MLIFSSENSLDHMINQYSNLKKTVFISVRSDPNVMTSDVKKRNESQYVLESTAFLERENHLCERETLIGYPLYEPWPGIKPVTQVPA